MNCLLIEDDRDDQDIFLLCLKEVRPEVECVVANDGVEALQMFNDDEKFTPRVIFLDINMPKMNGLDCLKQLRSIQRLAPSFLYVYSTTSEARVVKSVQELGIRDYIVKPAKTETLKKMLDKIFASCDPGKS